MAGSVMRRAVSKVLVGAMAVATLGAGQIAIGIGVASAAPVSQTVTTSNIKVTKTIDNPNPFPGDTVTSTVVIQRDGGVDRYLRSFTDFAPSGYQLLDVEADVYRGGPLINYRNDPAPFDGPGTQHPTTGHTRVWWTDHGTAMGVGGRLAVINKGVTLTFTYKVPSDAVPGSRTTGMEFEVETFSTVQRWDTLTGLNLSVRQPVTATTTEVSVPPTADKDASVTLSARVTPANASGTIQFKDGTTNIGAPVPVVGGDASLPHTFTVDGTHSISAWFSGTAGFTNSNSGQRNVEVATPDPGAMESTTIMTAPTTATVGASARISAQVSSTAPLVGTVQFYDRGTPIGPRMPVGNGAVSIDHTFTVAGPHQISVAFTGGAGVRGSASLPQTIQVEEAPVTPGPAGSSGSLGSLGGGSPIFGS